jgi:hypothetical protein
MKISAGSAELSLRSMLVGVESVLVGTVTFHQGR